MLLKSDNRHREDEDEALDDTPHTKKQVTSLRAAVFLYLSSSSLLRSTFVWALSFNALYLDSHSVDAASATKAKSHALRNRREPTRVSKKYLKSTNCMRMQCCRRSIDEKVESAACQVQD